MLVVTKHSKIGPVFDDVIRATAAVPGVRLVVKCHPAETAEPYERDAVGASHVTMASPDDDLAALLAVATLVITVNSTVAIDGLVLGVPALVLAVPNNLSPLVDAEAMIGPDTPAAIEAAVRRFVCDSSVRREVVDIAGGVSRQIRCTGGRARRRSCRRAYWLSP